ncbi:MAG: diacylglycerol kinase [Spirochaetaceae bacterium]|jgi:diacylglycerol kinase family enzyme|nr:diacylglycerol kinase [Spirochaetaceae bacterium]
MNIRVFEDFASALAAICAASPLAQGRPLFWTCIANPRAGGFTIGSRWKKHRAVLERYAALAGGKKRRGGEARPSVTSQELNRGPGSLRSPGVVLTSRPGDAGDIVRALLDEAASFSSSVPSPFFLVITAGGDGTSLEAQLSLYEAHSALRSNFAILRLPMGTGNDGADAWELDEALDLLTEEVTIEYSRALRLRTSTGGKGPFLAFNILSIGLDAFVTHMTNKTKGRFPGDSYKVWVDIASLLYDRVYKVGPMALNAYDEGGDEILSLNEPLLLAAMGVTGKRTYGSHKMILPDARNVCVLRQMSLFRKLSLKGLFNTGGHVDKKEAVLCNASRLEFRYEYPVLAQMDGETVRLTKEDFPVSIELTEPAIPILRKLSKA